MNFTILAITLAVLIIFRFLKTNMVTWFILWWIACYVTMSYTIQPPMPSSLVNLFMIIISIGLLAYTTAASDRQAQFFSKLTALLTDRKYDRPLIIILILIPTFAAVSTYRAQLKEIVAPMFGRTVHPAPPESISFKGKKIDLAKDNNPYRKLEKENKDEFEKHVKNGKRVYVQNCMFCHGDNMEGKGMYAYALNPKPTNFQDATTIAMLTETFLFWRIAKGGPGLPEESGYWETAMPAWEKFLSEDDIWDVILYLYDFTDQRPRSKEHH